MRCLLLLAHTVFASSDVDVCSRCSRHSNEQEKPEEGEKWENKPHAQEQCNGEKTYAVGEGAFHNIFLYISFFKTNIHLTENCTMSSGTSSRYREKKVTDEDFDGNDLRALIKNQFFDPKRTYGISYDSNELSFFFAKAYAEGEVLSSRDFKRKNYRTGEEFEKELRERANKLVRAKNFFKNKRLKIKRGIETMCNERGFLRREGWGGDIYDMLLTSIYYRRTSRILKFYKYDLTSQKYQFRTDYGYEKFSKGKKVLNSEFPYLNLFLKFDGIHYEILQRKPETTDKDLADLLNTKKAGFFGWEKYFSRVGIKDNGLCYFNAVTKAVRLALKYEREDRDRDYPEGGGFRAQSPRTSSLPFQSGVTNLTGERTSKERKDASKKRKRKSIMDFVDEKFKVGSESDKKDQDVVVLKYDSDDDVEIISAEQNEKNIRAKERAKAEAKRAKEREERARAALKRMRDNRRRFSSVLKF